MSDLQSKAGDEVAARIDYLLPTSRINRRFWAPGEEYNTGVYAPCNVTIRNARLAGPFQADVHGFCLSTHRTAVTDWDANYDPYSAYAAEVVNKVRELTGADLVVPMGGMVRTSGLTSASMQPRRPRRMSISPPDRRTLSLNGCIARRAGKKARAMTGSSVSRCGAC